MECNFVIQNKNTDVAQNNKNINIYNLQNKNTIKITKCHLKSRKE